ncbi:hypothetical protein GM658_06440 [Pseudoduganella eburnea]|uniref:Uncharacterized protein n=1 Tax=Massilia eburnea TaxID=1776165 RepID=A0A6L6QCJ5_9BURK|nr:hypothetical protein [Massilia eburnea]MTW10238.1 hypothetical protein [Massilia eburnea]
MKRSKTAFAAALSSASLAALLAGCGGGGGGDASAVPAQEPAPATSASADVFTAAMVAIVGSTSDTTEPDDVERVAPTRPDDREPVPVE